MTSPLPHLNLISSLGVEEPNHNKNTQNTKQNKIHKSTKQNTHIQKLPHKSKRQPYLIDNKTTHIHTANITNNEYTKLNTPPINTRQDQNNK